MPPKFKTVSVGGGLKMGSDAVEVANLSLCPKSASADGQYFLHFKFPAVAQAKRVCHILCEGGLAAVGKKMER